ncbi:hypothetical protein CJ030_MR2G027126 [Morella rubra]|uniref:Uncharacterized protein n=1 Tax=Morella rubra TaxID=262757 RepID=A0A6A1W8M1_9ROSI|nr:hypothetical protein CJ030_MR2G027126 [Morella rubra]
MGRRRMISSGTTNTELVASFKKSSTKNRSLSTRHQLSATKQPRQKWVAYPDAFHGREKHRISNDEP